MTSLFIFQGFQIYGANVPDNLGIGRLWFIRDLKISIKWYLELLSVIKRYPVHDDMRDIIGRNPALHREPVQTLGRNVSEFLNCDLGDYF